MILSVILSIIFFVLGIIHLNWVFGGKFGFSASLPTKETGERVLNPKKIDSGIIGLALISFGIFYLLKIKLIDFNKLNWIIKYGSWIIPSIFILRAIGEFKYIGFFKKVKKTTFGRLDTKFFSPLCLIIGVIGILINYFY